MEVFEQCITQKILILCMPHDRGYSVNPRQLTGTPAPFTHDEFISGFGLIGDWRFKRSDDDRLEYPNLLDRSGELGKLVFIEDRSWLFRVRDYCSQWKLCERGPWHLDQPAIGIILQSIVRRNDIGLVTSV